MPCSCGSTKTKESAHIASNGISHLGLYCSDCEKWIKWIPQGNVNIHMIMPIGAHKGKELITIYCENKEYCQWFAKQRGGLARKFEALLDVMEQKI